MLSSSHDAGILGFDGSDLTHTAVGPKESKKYMKALSGSI